VLAKGILAVARSLGDRSLKDFVTGEPDTFVTDLTDEDTHLIIACDGVSADFTTLH
jgi:protein phosphatase PTC1